MNDNEPITLVKKPLFPKRYRINNSKPLNRKAILNFIMLTVILALSYLSVHLYLHPKKEVKTITQIKTKTEYKTKNIVCDVKSNSTRKLILSESEFDLITEKVVQEKFFICRLKFHNRVRVQYYIDLNFFQLDIIDDSKVYVRVSPLTPDVMGRVYHKEDKTFWPFKVLTKTTEIENKLIKEDGEMESLYYTEATKYDNMQKAQANAIKELKKITKELILPLVKIDHINTKNITEKDITIIFINEKLKTTHEPIEPKFPINN